MENQLDYQSLFDFLKRAAGPDLGKEVHAAAREKNIKILKRDVSNTRYTGTISLYPVSFLKEYFDSDSEDITFKKDDKDDLPF